MGIDSDLPPSPPLPPKTDSPPLPSRNSANSPPPLPAREIPSPTERNNTNDNEKSPPQNMNLLTQKSNASNAKNTPKIQIPARQRAVSAGRRMLSKKTPSPRNSGNIVTSPSPVSPKSPFSNPKKILEASGTRYVTEAAPSQHACFTSDVANVLPW